MTREEIFNLLEQYINKMFQDTRRLPSFFILACLDSENTDSLPDLIRKAKKNKDKELIEFIKVCRDSFRYLYNTAGGIHTTVVESIYESLMTTLEKLKQQQNTNPKVVVLADRKGGQESNGLYGYVNVF